MTLEIIDCEQGSDNWLKARCGLVTMSHAQCLMAKSADKKVRKKYLYDLAGEILSGEPAESYSNKYMERGREWEDEARKWFCFQTDLEVKQVGFIKNHSFLAGASPDGLIGSEAGLEVKTRLARLQLEVLEEGVLPNENKAQVQGNMWITGRSHWWYVSYCKGIKPFLLKVARDEKFIAELAVEVSSFNSELNNLVERFR